MNMSSEERALIIVASGCFLRSAIHMEDMSDVFTILAAIDVILALDTETFQFPVHRISHDFQEVVMCGHDERRREVFGHIFTGLELFQVRFVVFRKIVPDHGRLARFDETADSQGISAAVECAGLDFEIIGNRESKEFPIFRIGENGQALMDQLGACGIADHEKIVIIDQIVFMIVFDPLKDRKTIFQSGRIAVFRSETVGEIDDRKAPLS